MSTRMSSQRKINKLDIFTDRWKDKFTISSKEDELILIFWKRWKTFKAEERIKESFLSKIFKITFSFVSIESNN